MKLTTYPTLALAAACLYGTGCSLCRGSTETMYVNSSVPDSYVTINDTPYKMPASVEVPRDKTCIVEVAHPGYKPVRKVIESHMNATGALDLAGAWLFLLPIIGLLSPGKNSLDETTINLTLIPDPSSTAAAMK